MFAEGIGAMFFSVGAVAGLPSAGSSDDDASDPYIVVRQVSPVPPTLIDNMNVDRSVQMGYVALQGSYEVTGGRFYLTSQSPTVQALIVSDAILSGDVQVTTRSRSGTSFPVARLRAAPPLIGGWVGYVGSVVAGAARVRKFEGTTMPNVKLNVPDGTLTGNEDVTIRVTGTGTPLVEVFADGVLKASWVDTSGSASDEGYAGVLGGNGSPPPVHNFGELEIEPL